MELLGATGIISFLSQRATAKVWPRIKQVLNLDEHIAARKTGEHFRVKASGTEDGLNKWIDSGELGYWIGQVLGGKDVSEERMAQNLLDHLTLGPHPDREDLALEIVRHFFRILKDQALNSSEGLSILDRQDERRHREDLQGHAITHQKQDEEARKQDERHRELIELYHNGGFPPALYQALVEPGLKSLWSLLESGAANEALEGATKRLQAVDNVLRDMRQSAPQMGGTINENVLGENAHALIRSYQQELMFLTANANVLRGDRAAGQPWWERARDLGPIDPDLYGKAIPVLFNLGLTGELKRIISKLHDEASAKQSDAGATPAGAKPTNNTEHPSEAEDPPEGEIRELEKLIEKASIYLAFLKGDWPAVRDGLASTERSDERLLYIQSLIRTVDPEDVHAVKATAQSISSLEPEGSFFALIHARLAIQLLRTVIRGETPLTFNREPLTGQVLSGTQRALSLIEPDMPLRKEALLLGMDAADVLDDELLAEAVKKEALALPEDESPSAFIGVSAPLPPEEIDHLLGIGHLGPAQAVVLQATSLLEGGDPVQAKKVLHESLYEGHEPEARALILETLVQLHIEASEAKEAKRLIESTPIPEPNRTLLRGLVARKLSGPEDGLGEELRTLEAGIEKTPLSMRLAARLANVSLALLQRHTSDGRAIDGKEQGDKLLDDEELDRPESRQASSDQAQDAVTWVRHYHRLLPSRSVQRLYAEALLAARLFDDLLACARALDSIYEKRARELEAWALDGLGNTKGAAGVFVDLAAKYPDDLGLALNASALLMESDQSELAMELLTPYAESFGAEFQALSRHGAANQHDTVDSDSLQTDSLQTKSHHLAPKDQDPVKVAGLLRNLAMATVKCAPRSPKASSKAFDHLSLAYHLHPDPDTAMQAWAVSRNAGREEEAWPFIQAVQESARQVHVENAEDLEDIFEASGETPIVFTGGIEALAEHMQRVREQQDALAEFSGVHMVSYADQLRFSGSPWEHWSWWTLQYRHLSIHSAGSSKAAPSEASSLSRDTPLYSVLMDWPAAGLQHQRDHQRIRLRDHLCDHLCDKPPVLIDSSALYTLGILGAPAAEEILDALGTVNVRQGTLGDLKLQIGQLASNLQMGGSPAYQEVVERLDRLPGVVVRYSEQIESAASDIEASIEAAFGLASPEKASSEDSASLLDRPGASRVDLGATLLSEGIYVSDVGARKAWPGAAGRITMTSARLLKSLNVAGLVPADRAEEAARRRPRAFEGWHEEDAASLPETVFFDRFALIDWFSVNLLADLLPRVGAHHRDARSSTIQACVGPWAWAQLRGEADKQEIVALAHTRATSAYDALKCSIEKGVVTEIAFIEHRDTASAEAEAPNSETGASPTDAGLDAPRDPSRYSNSSKADSTEEDSMEGVWKSALGVLRTAQKYDLQIWADDRFYSLMLWHGGPTVTGPEVEKLRASLADWAREAPPVPTTEILLQLVRSGDMPRPRAEALARDLYDEGYRPTHPLLLTHALRQYPLPKNAPEESALPPPFEAIADDLRAFPVYLPDAIPLERRAGFARVAASVLAKRLITTVWMTNLIGSNSDEPGDKDVLYATHQRMVLASALLCAVEKVFAYHQQNPAEERRIASEDNVRRPLDAKLEEARPSRAEPSENLYADRTPAMFWPAIVNAFQTLPAAYPESEKTPSSEDTHSDGNAEQERLEQERSDHLQRSALNWLGAAAYQRPQQRPFIIRMLEDNVLDSIGYAADTLEEARRRELIDENASPVGTAVMFSILAAVPLVDTDLVSGVDTLFLRMMGVLGDFKRQGRSDTTYTITARNSTKSDIDGDATTVCSVTVSDEKKELAAIEVLRKALSGDPGFGRFVRGGELAFSYVPPQASVADDSSKAATDSGTESPGTESPGTESPGTESPNSVPEEAPPAPGVHPEIRVNVKCSLLTLLLSDAPIPAQVVFPLALYQVGAIDPGLGSHILSLEEQLLSPDENTSLQARKELALHVLRSGYFELQRDLEHAIGRLHRADFDTLAEFIGFVGEEAARSLEEHTSLIDIGGFVDSAAHLRARLLLCRDDSQQIRTLIRELSSDSQKTTARARTAQGCIDQESSTTSGSKTNSSNTNSSDAVSRAQWIQDRAEIATHSTNPFVSAWALRHVLLGLSELSVLKASDEGPFKDGSTSNDGSTSPSSVTFDPVITVEGEKLTASKWARGYIEAALTAGSGSPTKLKQRMVLRRELSASALKLAAFACAGGNHVREYDAEDPVTDWLAFSLPLGFKVMSALVKLYGGLENAAPRAAAAVQNLRLDERSIHAPDLFDPSSFEPASLGQALTLFAMLSARESTKNDERAHELPWWTRSIEDIVYDLQGDSIGEHSPSQASPDQSESTAVQNRLGLIYPLSVSDLTKRLLA